MQTAYAHTQHDLTVILISGKDPNSSNGGYAQYAKHLATTLSSFGYRVHLYCVGTQSKTTRYQYGIVRQINIPFLSVLRGFEMVGLLPCALMLTKSILKDYKTSDKTILWGIGPWSVVGALIKHMRPSCTYIADYFTTIAHEYTGMMRGLVNTKYTSMIRLQLYIASFYIVPIYTILERYLLYKSDRIVTHYISTQTILTNQFRLPESRFTTLPYTLGPPKPSIAIASKLNTIPLLITVSRHDARKGIAVLLSAYHSLVKRNIRFQAMIIGNGILLSEHTRLIVRLDLQHVVIIKTHVNDINPYLDRASLFVLPSYEEGSSSLAVLEAMSRGICVVSTTIDGIPEDIENGKSGVLVAPGNPQLLAHTIEDLLADPQRRKRLGKNARERYTQLHGPQTKESLRTFLSSL